MTLSEYMAKASLTDKALADQIGIARPHLTRIRNGKRSPSLAVALRLADATKLPVKTFLKAEVG